MATRQKKMISMKKVPVGYRLNPSDDDIVDHHLKRKLLHVEEQYCLIPEFDIYKLPPWDLIGKFNELSVLASDGDECFFFHLRSSRRGKSISRKTPQGFWKCTGKGRRPQDTDRTKWRKRILVYHIGKQKQATKTDWAMHEYEITTNPSIVLCRVHKIKQKGKQKVDSASSGADSNGSPGETALYETQVHSQEASPEASINITMEFQSPTPPSDGNVAEHITSSTQRTQIVAEERQFLGEDAYSDLIELADLENLECTRILTREQSTCSGNRLSYEGTQEYNSWSYLQGDTLEEAGHMYTSPHMNSMEEMHQLIGNKSFNGSVSGMAFSHLKTHGPAARALLISVNCGPGETNFKEGPESFSDFQNLVPSPYPDTLLPLQLRMLPELSANTPYLGQGSESHQPNLEATRDFGIDSPVATESMDLDLLSDSFLVASSPSREI